MSNKKFKFNHDANKSYEACGWDKEDWEAVRDKLKDILTDIRDSENGVTTSALVEKFYTTLSKEELCIVASNTILSSATDMVEEIAKRSSVALEISKDTPPEEIARKISEKIKEEIEKRQGKPENPEAKSLKDKVRKKLGL